MTITTTLTFSVVRLGCTNPTGAPTRLNFLRRRHIFSAVSLWVALSPCKEKTCFSLHAPSGKGKITGTTKVTTELWVLSMYLLHVAVWRLDLEVTPKCLQTWCTSFRVIHTLRLFDFFGPSFSLWKAHEFADPI